VCRKSGALRIVSARNALLAAVVVALWAGLPAFASRSVLDMLVFTAIYTIAGLGVSFLLGQCGIVSLAQSVFFGIGAYASAYCTTQLGWPAPSGFLMGCGASAAIAFAVGWPILMLSGYFLALATLALAIIGHVIFLEWDWLTGGTLGIGGILPLDIFGLPLNAPLRFYYLVWPVAVLLLWLHRNLLQSRAGFAIRAMRDAPAAAQVLGVDTHMLKVQMFLLSAVLGSLGGSLFAHYVTFVSVDSFGVDRAINFLLLAVLGGAQTIFGTILGALFITVMPNVLSRFGDIHGVLFAMALILAVIFLPEGFGGAIKRALGRGRREMP
jgi:branched-chain amino acid transport system permease protein